MTGSTSSRLGPAGEFRVAVYALALAGLATGLLWANPEVLETPARPWNLAAGTWVLVALGYGIAELRTLDIEIGRHTHSQSLTVVPTLFALLLYSPLAAVAIAVAGVTLSAAVTGLQNRRLSLLKTCWNLCLTACHVAAAGLLIRAVIGSDLPQGPVDWTILLSALVLGEWIALVSVPLVISVYEGEFRFDAFPDHRRAQLLIFVGATFAVTAVAASFAEPFLLVYASVPVLGVGALLSVYARLSRGFRDLEYLHTFTSALDVDADDEILRRIAGAVNASGAVIVREEQDSPVALLVEGDRTESGESSILAALGQVGGAAAVHRATRTSEPALAAVFDELNAEELIAMPIVSDAGRIGVLAAYGRSGARASFTTDENALFLSLGRAFASRVINERLTRRDHLTGLPNRDAFMDALERALDVLPAGAVVQLDLVRFREINESLGHAVGDKVLVEVAARLRAVIRHGDVVSRLGGDEFAVLMTGQLGTEALIARSDALRQALEAPLVVEDITFDVAVAAGAARWPEDGLQASQLMARAEIALGRAKRANADFVLFDESFDVATPRRLALASDLKAAIENRDIGIHLQPKVDLRTGKVVGAEALARWTHPELGFIPPNEFIPLVEQAGLVGKLTRLVLSKAADSVADLARLGLEVPVAVNLSPRDLLDPSLPSAVDALLEGCGVAPHLLEVEITEGAMVVDFDTSVATLDQLRARGLKVAVDDFGTGYSSLTYLHRLPLDSLKIDRSFVNRLLTEESAAAIVRASIRMAHDLGLTVVAEGIEDEDTLGRLTQLGCDEAQGYLLARPLPAGAFLDWMIDNHDHALPHPPLPAGERHR